MKTYVAKAGEVEKGWILIDADGLVVGRLAALIATKSTTVTRATSAVSRRPRLSVSWKASFPSA